MRCGVPWRSKHLPARPLSLCLQFVEVLLGAKLGLVREQLLHHLSAAPAAGGALASAWHLLPAYSVMVAASVAAAGASTLLVLALAPAAAGSGIPEVIGYLNGVMVPNLLAVPTLLVKLASSCLLMLSGLSVGMEGPLIHIGAAVGAAISKGAWAPG